LHYAVGVDQQLFRGATLSVNYIRADGVHQFYSQNINSQLPDGSYPIPPTGNSGPLVQDQYQSGGVFHQNQLIANVNIRSSRLFSLGGYGVLNYAKADTNTITSFPATNFYNIGEDYGRANFDTRYRMFLYGSLNLPHGITASPILILSAGTPYNVTLGTVNGSGQTNSRPAFGPSNGVPAGETSATGVHSNTIAGCGSFVTPSAQYSTIIPINLCTGPAQFTTNLRVTKTFGFGPKTGVAAQGGQGGGPGGPGGPGGGSRGPGGGRGGPGGLGGPGGFGSSTGRRYNFAIGVQALNLFNDADLSTPNGTLTSQQFGVSTQLAGRPFTGVSGIRQISLQTSFTF
jgi:hypothetical protein